MSINLEQKFRCDDIAGVIRDCRAERYKFRGSMAQDDYYLDAGQGRLKIRVIDHVKSELIYYIRPDKKGPRISSYFRLPLDIDERTMKNALRATGAVVGQVNKNRTVFYNGSVRINIDRVRGLGNFVEFEAELEKKAELASSARLLANTRTALRLFSKNALSHSYFDMLSAKNR